MAGYDIIGDVHGQARALARLCAKLGYDDWGHHPGGRKAVFIGDLNDKGPENSLVVDRVRAWTEAGRALAIMGNHELNAVAWNVRRRKGKGYLRPRSNTNRKQHRTHLDERTRNPWRYAQDLAFFRTLPLWLDLGDVRLVHACWDEGSLDTFRADLREGRFVTEDTLHDAYTEGTRLFRAVENALKGPGITLPKSLWYKDMQGKQRKKARMRWWTPEGANLAELCLLKGKPPKAEIKKLRKKQPKWRVSYTDDVPVFFGHYHLTGKPKLTADNAVCVDWGAGSGRRLTAYRFSGGAISADDFVSVKVR